MQVFGGKWSMGTSAIHFLDLFAYLSNSKIKSLSFFSHTKKLNKAKRKGYFEFVGYFKAKSYNNNEIKIEKLSNSDLPMLITFKSKDSFILNYQLLSKNLTLEQTQLHFLEQNITNDLIPLDSIVFFLEKEKQNLNTISDEMNNVVSLYDEIINTHDSLYLVIKELAKNNCY